MSGKVTKTVKERFFAFVKKTRGRECWLWQGNRQKHNGYGRMWVGDKNVVAHRVAWDLFKTPERGELLVLHHCDVRACVNPDHLFLGTHKDNGVDKQMKGRAANGHKNGNSKLSPSQVRRIRKSTKSLRDLAAIFGIDYTQVWNIRTRRQWRHI